MDSPNLLTRIAAPLLPLIVIALIFGGAGYALKKQPVAPVPELPASQEHVNGLRGTLKGVSGNQLTLTTDDGQAHSFDLVDGAKVEVLRPSSLAQISAGDWLNAGAIDHAETVLALTALIVIPNPVVAP